MMTSAATASIPQGRKRRRRQLGLAAADGARSPTPGTLPRVATAPANFAASSTSDVTAGTVKEGKPTKTRRPFEDNSELESQIATLALIRAYGYGTVPGTPLRRGTTSSPGAGRRPRTTLHGERDFGSIKSSGVEGSCITDCGAPAAVGKVGRVEHQANARGRSGATRANREPWIGPLDVGESGANKTPEPGTIERHELRRAKTRRLAAVKGHCLLSQVGRVLHRRDLGTTAQLLASARAEFRAAGDVKGASEVDEALVKIKADIVMQTIEAARKSRDYDRLQELMFEALHYFSVLARHGEVNRHDTLGASERRDADKRMYERLRHPRQLCREYALEDGRRSRQEAAALAKKSKYADARARMEDARRCFVWAGGAEEELRQLSSVGSDLEIRENATCGDRLTEGVASKLQFLTSKDYSVLFSDLSKAAVSYEVAKDHDGAKVVRLVTAALRAVLLAEQRWMQAADALKERMYSSASQLMGDAKLSISDATKGLPFVSPSLARAGKILSPPGGLDPLDIVAELAALDGLKDHTKSVRALEQGMLDKAQHLNTRAREVFEFTARCCRTTARCHGIGSGNSGGGSSSSRANTPGSENNAGGSVRSSRPSSPTKNDTAAGVVAVEEIGSDVVKFSLSEEELNEGDALLVKIRRCTSAPTNPDDRATKPKSRATVHPGVRHRVEDLLDEVSETEDVITRKKALERGDKLMVAFRDTMAENSSAYESNARALTTAVTAVTTAGKILTRSNTARSGRGLASGGGIGGGAGGARASTSGSGKGAEDGREQQVPGPGGALSPETADACLQLLADAKEAYEGQGFALQADGAARLRAELVADRCLARVPALARPAATAAAASETDMGASADPSAAPLDDEPWLAPWARGVGVGVGGVDFQAARAAALEAEENYVRAGNPTGALTARRTEMSLRGDEVMVSIAPLLKKRSYDAVVEGLGRARRLYTDAGPQGLEGLGYTRDPLGLVKKAAMQDGQRLKGEAVRVLRDGDVEASRRLCEQAQSCFSFVDREGMVDATADVYAAIHMVTRLASGDAVAAAAESALGDGESEKASRLLKEAKSFYHHAQLSYERLVDQVTTLLEEHPDDLEVARKAMQLQDNINGIYDSRRDGQRAVKVELRLDCLAADASLENLAQVVDHDKFDDARTLLSAAALVYERSADVARLSKVTKISSLVGLVEGASRALDEGRYTDAERLVAGCLADRAALAAEQPLCLRPPDCALLHGGGDGAKTAVLLRVRAAGDAERASALELLEAGEFAAAESAASSALKRFQWWASHHPDEPTSASGGGGGDVDGGGGEAEEGRELRQGVVRAAEELTASVAAAAGRARAEGLTLEGRQLKSMGKFVAAVDTLRSAAALFHAAGLGRAAAETRAEAACTGAEALLLTSIGLHGERNFEAIEEHLQRAEALLVEAQEQTAETTKAATTAVTPAAKPTSGDPAVDPNNGPATRGGASTCVDVPRHASRSPVAAEDSEEGAAGGASCRLLEDLINFRSRVAGDMVIGTVAPVLGARDYDEGLRLMLEAEAHYAAIKAGRWSTTVAAAFAAAAAATGGSKENALSSSAVTLPPKELVTKRAAHDGDRLRGEAATAIQKEKDPVKARALLSGAEACMAWAGVDPFAAGAEAVSKDIRVFESRAGGDEICKGLIGLLREKEFELAKEMLEDALGKYRQGDAFKQIADTRAVAFCVERESDLCSEVVTAVTSGNPTVALKTLEEARPVFQIAAELRSAVLREVAELLGVKHQHIVVLSTLCRAWMQCVNGNVPTSSEEDDSPDPAVVLEGAMSDVRRMIASEAPILDIPFNLLQEACGNVAAVVSETPKMLPTGAAPAGQADLDVSFPDSGSSTVPDTLGGGTGDDEGGHVDRGSIDAQPVQPGGGAAGGAIEEGIRGNADDEFVEFDDDADVVEDGPDDDGETQQGGGCTMFPQQENGSKGLAEAKGLGIKPSEEMDSTEGMVLGADGDSPVGDESAGFRASAIAGAESGPSPSPESANAVEPPPPSAGPGTVVGELEASATDTDQAVRHRKEEGSADATGGDDSVLVADDSLKDPGQEEGIDGSKSFMSISTKSLEGPASVVRSADPDASAVAGSLGDIRPPQPSAASLETNGHEYNPVEEGLPSDYPQKAVPAEGTSAVVEESKPANADREKSLEVPKADKDDENSHHHSEEAAPAPAVAHPEEEDDGVDYDLDSDFGDDSDDGHAAGASTAAAGASSAVPTPPTTIDAGETKDEEAGDDNSEHLGGEAEDDVDSPGSSPPDKTSALEIAAGGPEVAHATVDDESDYPPDIDHVDEGSHSGSSGSDLETNDGSSGGSSSGEEEGSSESRSVGGSKTSRPSSGSSSGSLSISDSDDGDSAHDDSTASSPARARDGVVGTPPPEAGTTVDQDEDNDDDDDSLGGSSREPLNGSSLEEAPKAVENAQDDPQATHDDCGGDAAAEPEPETAIIALPDSTGSPSVETSERVDTETTDKLDQQEASPATTSMGHTKSDALEVASGPGAAEGTADCAADGGGDGDDGHGIGKSDGATVDQTTTAEPGTVEAEVAKEEDVYRPNLDVIDTSVDVGDLHKRFSLMLTSSFSPPADGSAADEPLAAASETSSAHLAGDGYHYTQDNWDQYNAEHGWHHDGDPQIAPSPHAAHEALTAADGDRPQEQDETLIEHGYTPSYDTVGGEGQIAVQPADGEVSGAPAGGDAIDDAVPSGLGGSTEQELASPSLAAEVPAAGTQQGGGVEDGVGRGQKQEQPGNGEDSDNLYDIDDHGLFSSEDD